MKKEEEEEEQQPEDMSDKPIRETEEEEEEEEERGQQYDNENESTIENIIDLLLIVQEKCSKNALNNLDKLNELEEEVRYNHIIYDDFITCCYIVTNI